MCPIAPAPANRRDTICMRIAIVSISLMLGLGACGGSGGDASEGREEASSKQTQSPDPEATRPWPSAAGPGKTYSACADFAAAYTSQTARMVETASRGEVVEMEQVNRGTTELVLANKKCVPESAYDNFKTIDAEYGKPRPLLPKEMARDRGASEECRAAWSDALYLRDVTAGVKSSGAGHWTEILDGFEALQEINPECFTDENVRHLTEDASG